MKMNLKKGVISISVAFLTVSCLNDSTSDLTEPIAIGNVTYTSRVKAIIDNNCITCHANVPVNGAPMPLTTYDNVKTAIENRGLLDRISRQNGQPGLMPNGGPRMPQTNIDLIVRWNTEGLQQ